MIALDDHGVFKAFPVKSYAHDSGIYRENCREDITGQLANKRKLGSCAGAKTLPGLARQMVTDAVSQHLVSWTR